MWEKVWTEAYSNIDRLDDYSFSDCERASIRSKAEEVKRLVNVPAVFFKVIKSGDTVYLQAAMQFKIK